MEIKQSTTSSGSFWWFQLAVWGAYGVGTLPIHLAVLKNAVWWEGSLLSATGFCLLSCVVSVLFTSGMRLVYRHELVTRSHWGFQGLVIVILCLLAAFIKMRHLEADLFSLFGEYKPTGGTIGDGLTLFFAGYWIHVCLYLSWSLLYLIVKRWSESRQLETRYLQAENERQKAEIKLLRAQIQPHFLYNALNELANEADKNADLAKVVQNMTEYLRFGLKNRGEVLVELGEEIDAISKYLSLERLRYGRGFSYDIDVDEECLTVETAGILIQPLVENAIKHGRSKSSGSLKIKVKVYKDSGYLRIVVGNTGVWEGECRQEMASGVGLENLVNRLKLIYNENYSLSFDCDGGWVFVFLSIGCDGIKKLIF
ncbi:MAG: sensor histidine kinase [Verrucomicrobiales bacterium]